MASYIIRGNCDEVCAKLKNTLEEQDAGFKANLNAMFKPGRPPARKPMPAPSASSALAVAPSGASLSLTRKSDDGNMRSHLRGSPRGR